MDLGNKLFAMLGCCEICPRRCKVNRLEGEKGYCKVGSMPVVSSYFAHHGEESVIRGSRGSGTIFFTGCNLGCIFCQNFDIAHLMHGNEISIERLSEMMLELQDAGCHNINVVTPTHQVPFIIRAREILGDKLKIPMVYNTGGYDNPEIIKKLDGIMEIYMPDFKFWSPDLSNKYMNARDYADAARPAIAEMYCQVGGLKVKDGVATSGVLIRHLVMPNCIEDSKKILDWIAENTPEAAVNIMSQYSPYYRAKEFPEINRRITSEEYTSVLEYGKKLGLKLIEF